MTWAVALSLCALTILAAMAFRVATNAYLLARSLASAIEAGTVETEGLDAKHESAVPKADAKPLTPSPPITEES